MAVLSPALPSGALSQRGHPALVKPRIQTPKPTPLGPVHQGAAGPSHQTEGFRLNEGSVFFLRHESSSELNKLFCKEAGESSCPKDTLGFSIYAVTFSHLTSIWMAILCPKKRLFPGNLSPQTLNQFSTLLPNTSHKSYSGLLWQGFLFPFHIQVIIGFAGDSGSSSGLFSSELICATVCLPGADAL